MDRKKILAIDNDKATLKWLSTLLSSAGFDVSLADSGGVGLLKAAKEIPDLIILDLLLPDISAETVFTRIQKDPKTSHIPIIILSSKYDPREVIRFLEKGISDYIIKRPGIETELLGKCASIAARGREIVKPPSTGKLITFFSAKGGVGTSTICLNMAHSMAQQVNPKKVVVSDLALPFGSLAMMMRSNSGHTITKIISKPEPYNVQNLPGFLQPDKTWKVSLLQGSGSIADAQLLDPERINRLFKNLRSTFDYVLVDIGRALSRISIPILQSSECVVLVFGPDPVTVELTRLAMNHLQEVGVPRAKLFLVLNRAVGREGLTKPEIEERFKSPVLGFVPHSPENLQVAINQGMPFAARFPEDLISRVFGNLTSLLRTQIKDT